MYVETQIGDVAILDSSDWSLSLYLCCHLGKVVLSARAVLDICKIPLSAKTYVCDAEKLWKWFRSPVSMPCCGPMVPWL